MVNNHVDESQNKMAKAWEAEFLKFMKNYQGEHIKVTYSAEVGCKCAFISGAPVIVLAVQCLGWKGLRARDSLGTRLKLYVRLGDA